MKSIRTLAPVFALLLLGSAAAQTTKVLPLAYTSTEGPALGVYPFGYTHTKTQQVWDGSAVTRGVALVRGFKYRRDTGNKQAMPGRTYTNATISIGTTTVAPDKMSKTFVSNVTSTLTMVLNAGTLNLPAQPVPTTSPANFNIGINWTAPYIFDQSKGNLILQIDLPGAVGKSNYFVDAAQVTGGSPGSVIPFGTGGAFSSTERYQMSGNASTLAPGGSVDIGCGPFTKSYVGTLALGVSNTTWSGLNLPFDLGAIGATNNNLYVSLDVQLGFTTVLSGRNYESKFKTAIPNGPTFSGITFYAQGWYLDQNANNAGLVTTDALAMTTARTSSTPVTNLVGYYNTTSATGNHMFGTGRWGGPIIQFSGIFP